MTPEEIIATAAKERGEELNLSKIRAIKDNDAEIERLNKAMERVRADRTKILAATSTSEFYGGECEVKRCY